MEGRLSKIKIKRNCVQHSISISGIEVYIIKIFASCSFCYIYKDLLSQSPPTEIPNRYVLVEKSGSTYIIYLELIEGAVDNPAWMLALVKIKDEMTKLLPRHTFVFKIVDGGVENVLNTI